MNTMTERVPSVSPLFLVKDVWRHRGLIWQLTKREVIGRYRGSWLGLLWSFFNPLLMLAVYTFVFGVVLKVRWHRGTGSTSEFALLMFVALTVFNLFADPVNRAPGMITGQPSYVKKVVFPLEVIPCVGVGASLFHAAISFLVLIVALLMTVGKMPATALLLPVIIAPLLLFTLGVTFLCASLGVYIRDVAQVVGIITTVMLYLSPAFFPIDALPEVYRTLVTLNPLTFIIEQARAVLYWDALPDWSGLGIYAAIAALVAYLGFVWFQKTRRGFADVI